MINSIDGVTMSMVQYGFDKFYDSIAEFELKNLLGKAKLHLQFEEEDGDLQPITLKQFKTPIIMFLYLNGIAVIIVLAEIFFYKWQNWRNRKCFNI